MTSELPAGAAEGHKESLFTASEIAAALTISPRAVYKRLRGIRQAGCVVRDGQAVGAWPLTVLPADLREQIEAVAKERNYRDVGSLLSNPPARWEPPVPLAGIHPDEIARATKLRLALLPSLRRMNEPGTSPQEKETLGLQDYQREMGHAISARHWRRLFNRTIERDRGHEDWSRLELYCSDTPRQVAPAPGGSWYLKADASIREAASVAISGGEPSDYAKAALWERSFEVFEEGIAQSIRPRNVKRTVLQTLAQAAPFLARTPAAMKRAFERKLLEWRNAGRDFTAILDKRSEDSGWFRAPELSEEDRLLLLNRAADKCGGRLSQAFRELRENGALGSVAQQYPLGSGNKSYVPARIRNLVGPDIVALWQMKHGSNYARQRRGWVPRDHSGYNSGDFMQGDDSALPVYFWDQDAPYNPIRGQFLAMIDCRSTFILGWVLISEEAYNSRDILSLIACVHDGYGLPRKGFYFEKGPWAARLLTGGGQSGLVPVKWEETEEGFRRFGLKIMHAQRAQPKVIERVMGAIQCQMERDNGYAGRDERHDRFENVQKQLQMVRSGKIHASKFFMRKDEWASRLQEIVDTYNHERQNGKMLPGMSPWEGYQEFYGSVPLKRFDDSTRYLLASCRKTVTVGPNGISFQVGKERFTYKNEQTGALRGRKVGVYFSPENPELLSVVVPDLSEHMPFTVEREVNPPAMDPDSPLLAKAMRQNAAQNRYHDRLFRLVAHNFPEDFQRRMVIPMETTPEQESLGQNIEKQQAEIQSELDGKVQERQRRRQAVSRLGLPVSGVASRRNDQLAAAPELEQWLQDVPASTAAVSAEENL